MDNMGANEEGIAIGIIAPHELTGLIDTAIKGFPSFHPIFASYRLEEEAPQLAADLMDKVEVLLFSGPASYYFALQSVSFAVPAHYIPLTGTGLYRALFRLHKACGSGTLSVDTLTRQAAEKAARELDDPDVRFNCFDAAPHPSMEQLVQFHLQQLKSGACNAALSGIKSVCEHIQAEGYSAEWMHPTVQDVIVSLERALLSTESRRSKETQIVVGLVNVDDFGKLARLRPTENEVQKLKLDIHRMALRFVESLEGNLAYLGGDEYMFFTTRGIFERISGGYKIIPLAREAKDAFGVTLSIGIGFGRSANEAGTNARYALHHAKEAGGNICFIVREDKGIIGPLEMVQPMECDLTLLDAELIKRLEAAGIGVPYLSKLIAQVTRTGTTEYTAQQLALILNITVRSVHRLIVQWLDAKLIDYAGELKSPSKGRPTQVYRLVFLAKAIRN